MSRRRPTDVVDATAKDLARFWDKVDQRKPSDCWDWTGAKNHAGYGVFSFLGGVILAHRFSLLITGARIDGLWALHSCDRPACCNPHHLRVGTAKDNARDRWVRGEQACAQRAVFYGPIVSGEIVRRHRLGHEWSEIMGDLRIDDFNAMPCDYAGLWEEEAA